MLKPSRLHHSSCGEHCCNHIPETFGLLCWNVYKNNQKNPQPMILAGDFTTWSKTRMIKLQHIVEELSLSRVAFEKTGKVKSFMGKALNFIFYRGMELLEEEVLNDHKLSDHHPLFVQFKRIT